MTSTPTTRRLATTFVAALLACAAFAPSALGYYQDFRMPDNRAPAAQSSGQDLRSPDTRDAASGYAPTLSPQDVSTPSSPSSPSTDGFDWVSAAIGAAAVGGLLIVLLASVGGQRRLRGPRPGALHG